MTNKSSSLVHVKIEHSEAVESKKDILLTEAGILKITKAMKNYHTLRSKEFDIKINLKKKIKELDQSIKKFNTDLPKIKIPDVVKNKLKESSEDLETTKKKTLKTKNAIKQEVKKKQASSIDTELENIQAKLRELGAA